LADQDPSQISNFDGGTASGAGDDFSGGSSTYPASPIGQTGGEFLTNYTNVAKTRADFQRINATFRDFDEPAKLRFIDQSLKVTQQADTLDFLNLTEFFHPLQSFSEYEKQTFVIAPATSANFDSSSFSSTNGEVSMIIARAYYLPEATERNLFWDYKGAERNLMGQFMVLTGAVKNGYSWNGWDLDPFSTYGHTGNANIAEGGLTFTNPTNMNVKLTIIAAS
jgi:hypothetical protein